jgi:hypothetical protein
MYKKCAYIPIVEFILLVASKITPVVKEPGYAQFDDATRAVQVGQTLWFGTFRGDRVAYRQVP